MSYIMLNLSMSKYFSVVLFFKAISLAIKEYIVIISNKSIVMIRGLPLITYAFFPDF